MLLSLSRRACGFDPTSRVLDLITSDSLALDLVSRCPNWKLYPLQWSFPAVTQNLRDMLIEARGDEVVVRAVRRRARPRACEAQAALDILNASVEMQGVATAAGSSVGGPTAWGGLSVEGLDLDELPIDLARDVLEEHLFQHCGLALDDEVVEDDAPVPEEDGQMVETETSADENALAAAVAEEQLGEPPMPSLDDLCAAAGMSPSGDVRCPLEPWASLGRIGRFTTWPANLPLEHRSCSMKCYVHSNCTSPALKTWRVTKAAMIRWLLSGELPAKTATTEDKKRLAVAHKGLFMRVVNPLPNQVAATSSGSAQPNASVLDAAA